MSYLGLPARYSGYGDQVVDTFAALNVQLKTGINNDKKIISIFAGSRNSETNVLLPILHDFIKLMNKKCFSQNNNCNPIRCS